jgi:transcriptional regulator with XRE-family HTH domain
MKLNGWSMRAIREARGASGSECARQLKVSQATWSNWERGVRDTSALRVLQIAQVLDVDYRAILIDPTQSDVEELAATVRAAAS